MEGVEIKSKDQAVRSRIAILCAKAAILISSLKSFPSHHFKTAIGMEDEEKEMMKREITHLKIKLARERMKSKMIKLCGLMELILQVMVVFCVLTFFLVLASKSILES